MSAETDLAARRSYSWDCECGVAPARRWTDYWECIASGHAHQVEDHDAIDRTRSGRGYQDELKWGVTSYPASPEPGDSEAQT